MVTCSTEPEACTHAEQHHTQRVLSVQMCIYSKKYARGTTKPVQRSLCDAATTAAAAAAAAATAAAVTATAC
eukprot:4783-Heterococcus_DN1.PRE.1